MRYLQLAYDTGQIQDFSYEGSANPQTRGANLTHFKSFLNNPVKLKKWYVGGKGWRSRVKNPVSDIVNVRMHLQLEQITR